LEGLYDSYTLGYHLFLIFNYLYINFTRNLYINMSECADFIGLQGVIIWAY